MNRGTTIYIKANEVELLYELLNVDVIFTEYDNQGTTELKDMLITKISDKLLEVME